jgi:hypothetical protein
MNHVSSVRVEFHVSWLERAILNQRSPGPRARSRLGSDERRRWLPDYTYVFKQG